MKRLFYKTSPPPLSETQIITQETWFQVWPQFNFLKYEIIVSA